MTRLLMIATVAAGFVRADETIAIRFRAVVGGEELRCGQRYPGIGTTRSTITPRDFRFYVHNVRLIDEAGKDVPVQLTTDDHWQFDDVALLDFEDATGGCWNGTPEMNRRIVGTAPGGVYRGLRFTLGVPMSKNHADLMAMPPPLNLTAMSWVWNAGRKFARLDFSSTGVPRGYTLHLGSTGCTPNATAATIPRMCVSPNRPEIELPGFDPGRDVVLADLAALLKDSNADDAGKGTAGCMSGPESAVCGSIFANFGLAFPGQPEHRQTFFRSHREDFVSERR